MQIRWKEMISVQKQCSSNTITDGTGREYPEYRDDDENGDRRTKEVNETIGDEIISREIGKEYGT